MIPPALHGSGERKHLSPPVPLKETSPDRREYMSRERTAQSPALRLRGASALSRQVQGTARALLRPRG